VAQVSLLLLERLRLVEAAHVEGCGEAAAEARVEDARAREKTPLKEARAHDHVARHFVLAILDRAHAVAHLEAGVPHQADETLDRARVPGGHFRDRTRKKHQDIDIGVREQLAAAVASHRNERTPRRRVDLGPEAAQDAIGQSRLAAKQALGAAMRAECGLESATPCLQLALPMRDRHVGCDRREQWRARA
jgi:hypothetical protein